MKTLMRNGRDRRSENPRMCHASKERVLLFGTDQRITSGPAATTAAFKGRIHGCTRTISRKRQILLLHRGRRPYMALRAISLRCQSSDAVGGEADIPQSHRT